MSSFGTLNTGIWYVVSIVLAIIGGIALYFTVFAKSNEKKYTGFMKWLYDFITFKKMMLESLLKIIYIVIALYITLSSLALISVSFVGFLVQIIFGNILARIIFEFSLVLLTICKNTTELNDKIEVTKKKKEENKD